MHRSSGRLLALRVLIAVTLGALLPASAVAADADAPAGLALRVAKVVALDDAGTVVNDAVVLVKGDRIEALGPAAEVAVPAGYRVLEFPEYWLVPGIVESHNHSSAGSWSDLNDMVYQTNPGLDTRSIAIPDNDWVKQSRCGGVTTTMMLPGSGTNLSGFGTIVSTGGHTPDEITMRTPGSLKVAQSGNPEWYFGGNGRSFMNWNTRLTIRKARAYCEKWEAYAKARDQGIKGSRAQGHGSGDEAETDQTLLVGETAAARETAALPAPEFDPIWHGFLPLFRGEIPVTNHTQMYQVLAMTVDMFATDFRLWTVTEHSSFDAWKVGPLSRAAELDPARNLWTIQGPRQFHFDRWARRMIGNAAGWAKHGIERLGINTDAPVIPQEELTYQSAMACWYGWLPYPALRAITAINAKAIGVYDQVGSVEPHKQADLSVWTGDPLDPRSACLLTIVRGQIVYDGTRGVRRF